MPSARGFTLIELLVVIAITVIISMVALVVFSQSLVKARDATRKSDLRAIAQALEIFYKKNNHYPYAAIWQDSSSLSNPWISDNYQYPPIPLDTNYIDKLPRDPKQNQGNPVTSATNITGYAYKTPNGGGCPASLGQTYILAAGLENTSDPDADGNKNYQYCGGDLISRAGSNVFIVMPQ